MDATSELVIKITADVKNATKGFGKLSGVATALAAGALAAIVVVITAIIVVAGKMAKAALDAGKALLQFGKDVNTAMGKAQAQTGLSDEAMISFRKSALNLVASDVPGDITEISEAMATVQQITGKTGQELELLTGQAIKLGAIFDKDINEIVRATNSAMVVFGDDGTRIMDQMTAVIQRTGDPADDLLDTINEYALVFGQAGFSSQQMFSILETGLKEGARNFDEIADLVKEFGIRIIDGSDKTEDALNDLFNAVGEGNKDFARLEQELGETEVALAGNTQALEDAEGAYADVKQTVKDLEKALGDAKRELKELATPNLAGMQEFDNQLFALRQDSNRARLALISLEEETPEFEAAQAGLDAINEQIDRVSLERDIQIEPQLRAIEQAALAGTEPLITFDQAMADIASKKEEIAGLEGAFAAGKNEAALQAEIVETLNIAQTELVENIARIEGVISDVATPAQDFLEDLEIGSLTGADAMQTVIEKLQQVQDPLLRNQLGVELFGTQFENLTEKVVFALDTTGEKLGEVKGATDAAFASTVTMADQWQTAKDKIFVALEPVVQEILPLFNEGMAIIIELVDAALPLLADFTAEFRDEFGPAVTLVFESLNRMAEALGLSTEKSNILERTAIVLLVPLELLLKIINLVAIGFNVAAGFVEVTTRAIDRLLSPLKIAVDLFEQLTGFDLSNFGGGGDSQTFNIQRLSPLPGFAMGGTNLPGGLSFVGENGVEMIDVPQGSNIIPNNELNNIGGDTITLTIDARGSADPSGIERAGGDIVDKLNELLRAKGRK